MDQNNELNKIEQFGVERHETESSGDFETPETKSPEVEIDDSRVSEPSDSYEKQERDESKHLSSPSPYISLGYPIYPDRFLYSEDSPKLKIDKSNRWIQELLRKISNQRMS